MNLLKGKNKKQVQNWQDDSQSDDIGYATRFEDTLESLRFRLANLEQDLNLVNEHPDKQKAVLDILTDIKNTKEQIQRHQTNLQCCKNMPSVRSHQTPSFVSDHNVWYDCWYDQKQNVYVTHNEYFKGIPDVHKTKHQQRYDQEIGDGGIVVREFKVIFLFGYPACKMHYKDGSSVWFLLPTMTDDMLTKEIITARLVPESKDDAIVYETRSEPWLEFGDGLKLAEREYELGMNLGRYSPIPLHALKLAAGRN